MRLRLSKRFPVRDLRGFRLVNGVHGDEVTSQKRLQALQIVAGISPFRFRAINALFGRRHASLGAVDVGVGDRNRTLERRNFSLFVGNLSYSITEQELRDAFSQSGRTVHSVRIAVDRETQRPRGFAFIEVATDADAESAIT